MNKEEYNTRYTVSLLSQFPVVLLSENLTQE